MDIVLLILGTVFLLLGIIGSILPVLPGPPLGWVGLLLLFLTATVPMDYSFLIITLLIAIVVTIMDYVIPALGTKKFGGTEYGMWGTTIGLILGLFVPPIGFLMGALLGAFVGELLYDSKDVQRAIRATFGSFLGFISSTFLKLGVSIVFLILFVKKVIQYWDNFF